MALLLLLLLLDGGGERVVGGNEAEEGTALGRVSNKKLLAGCLNVCMRTWQSSYLEESSLRWSVIA